MSFYDPEEEQLESVPEIPIEGSSSKKINKSSQNSMLGKKTIIPFLLGIIIGWMVIGWGIWPVQWENATAAELREDLRADYAYMSILAYQISPDSAAADRRMGELGEFADDAIIAVAKSPIGLHPQSVEFFQNKYVGIQEDEEVSSTEKSPNLLLISCGLTGILVLILIAAFYIKKKKKPPSELSTFERAQEFSRAAKDQQVDYAAEGSDPPLAQWVTTFLNGDDLFDDSNAINNEAGKFMGECGIGIADTIGVGNPKKVTALELWLFDKNDIQTITKVVMSDHIFNDVNGYGRLAAKGEPVLASNGTEIVLETETLQLAARIIDMSYGSGSAPDNSYFEKITLEMAVWEK